MDNKIINITGRSEVSHSRDKDISDDREKHIIDYTSEEWKLVLDIFFSEDHFFIMKSVQNEASLKDTIFQHFNEMLELLSKFETGELYDIDGDLYFKGGNELLFKIREITNRGEDYLERQLYSFYPAIINTVWKEKSYTKKINLYVRCLQIKSDLFRNDGADTIYSNRVKTHTIIESHASMDDNGHYMIGGKPCYVVGPVFNGEIGNAAEASIQALFNKGLVIVQDYTRNRFMLMREFSQLSRLWSRINYIEVRDQDGDLTVCCEGDREYIYVIRSITRAGQLYLDSHKPYPELLNDIWRNNIFSKKVFR